MTTTITPRRRATAVVNRDELARLLNDDFARAVRAIYGHAVFAERHAAAGDDAAAAESERAGRRAVERSLTICQLVYDFGGSVTAQVDELNAVLNADQVADPRWVAEGARRLRERLRQLRAINEPGLAKRLARVLPPKRLAAT
jgi:hypothetical protein